MSANIGPERGPCDDWYCKQNRPSDYALYLPPTAQLGDVRRCRHGRIWYCYHGSGNTWLGIPHWRRLSPIRDLALYLRAWKALS